MPYFNKVRQFRGARFGVTHDLVYEAGDKYLERWILWFGFTLRLHRFHKGDDDRAFHDHPWWFVTLPLQDYIERVPNGGRRWVRRFRPHFRAAKHRHIVELIDDRKVWTFIITGPKRQDWGFWHDERFIPHEDWLAQANAQEERRGAA